jgi:hypothetical protein
LIRGWAGYPAGTEQRIPLTTLDTVLGGRFTGEQLLIKIDVEGAEYQVLRGAMLTLRHFADTFELFWAAGYEARRIDAGRTPVTRRDIADWGVGRQDHDGGDQLLVRRTARRHGVEARRCAGLIPRTALTRVSASDSIWSAYRSQGSHRLRLGQDARAVAEYLLIGSCLCNV